LLRREVLSDGGAVRGRAADGASGLLRRAEGTSLDDLVLLDVSGLGSAENADACKGEGRVNFDVAETEREERRRTRLEGVAGLAGGDGADAGLADTGGGGVREDASLALTAAVVDCRRGQKRKEKRKKERRSAPIPSEDERVKKHTIGRVVHGRASSVAQGVAGLANGGEALAAGASDRLRAGNVGGGAGLAALAAVAHVSSDGAAEAESRVPVEEVVAGGPALAENADSDTTVGVRRGAEDVEATAVLSVGLGVDLDALSVGEVVAGVASGGGADAVLALRSSIVDGAGGTETTAVVAVAAGVLASERGLVPGLQIEKEVRTGRRKRNGKVTHVAVVAVSSALRVLARRRATVGDRRRAGVADRTAGKKEESQFRRRERKEGWENAHQLSSSEVVSMAVQEVVVQKRKPEVVSS
jgi:hypothetical protein